MKRRWLIVQFENRVTKTRLGAILCTTNKTAEDAAYGPLADGSSLYRRVSTEAFWSRTAAFQRLEEIEACGVNRALALGGKGGAA